MLKADNLPPFCAVVTKSGNLNFLEPSGPVQAGNGTALPLLLEELIVAHLVMNFDDTCVFIIVLTKVSKWIPFVSQANTLRSLTFCFLVDTFACLSTYTHLGFLHLHMNAFCVTSRTRVPLVIG